VEQLTLRVATVTDFSEIAEFIVRMNAVGDQRCLHCGDSVETVTKGLGEFGLPPERSIVLALSGGRMVGLVGGDLAPELGRGWLWGPYADTDDPLALCDDLMETFLTQIPEEIHVIDTFLDVRNLFLNPLARKHGFVSPRTVHIYRAERPAVRPPPGPAPVAVSAHQVDDLISLHEAAFPNTWRQASEMIENRDDSRALFVHTHAGRLEGYVHVEADPIEATGHVHFLAVVPESRGKGVGRKLLEQALDWCYNARELPSVSLTVFDDLVNARTLYESTGFRLAESGVTLRRTAPR
jgi:GNAT superfamily N-acetyltransferase